MKKRKEKTSKINRTESNAEFVHVGLWAGSWFLIGFGSFLILAGILICASNHWFLHGNYNRIPITAIFLIPGILMASYWKTLSLQQRRLRIRVRFLFLFKRDSWADLKNYDHLSVQTQQFHSDHDYPHDQITQGLAVYLMSNKGYQHLLLSEYQPRTWLITPKGLTAAITYAEKIAALLQFSLLKNYALEHRIKSQENPR